MKPLHRDWEPGAPVPPKPPYVPHPAPPVLRHADGRPRLFGGEAILDSAESYSDLVAKEIALST